LAALPFPKVNKVPVSEITMECDNPQLPKQTRTPAKNFVTCLGFGTSAVDPWPSCPNSLHYNVCNNLFLINKYYYTNSLYYKMCKGKNDKKETNWGWCFCIDFAK